MDEWLGSVADAAAEYPQLASVERFHGRIWSVRSDTVQPPQGDPVVRDVILHPGAVGAVVLDADDRVLLLRQYRHPVGMYLFEPPAGLLDEPGEDPLTAARRELVEEAGLTARRWHLLVDYLNSPGGTSEAFRCYLARDLEPAPGGRVDTGEAEEYDLPQAWVPLDQARDLVLAGRLGNPTAVIGILAAWAARAGGWADLRPADAPWPTRDHIAAAGRLPTI